MNTVIGITGGIASGKSTVSNMIADMGFTIVDADIAARAVVESGTSAFREVVTVFGEDILLKDGNINREKLGTIIFHDEEKRVKLNQIVHPAVRKYMNDQKEAAFARGESIVFMDIPLLFESNLTKMVDKTLLVYVDTDTQLQRLMNRNDLSKNEALARISSQMPLVEKKELADEIINNNGTIAHTKLQLYDVMKKWNISQ